MFVQVQLVSGSTHTTCWLEQDNRLRCGVRLSLRDHLPEKGRITRISDVKLSHKPRTQWKVGDSRSALRGQSICGRECSAGLPDSTLSSVR